jgi:hypothetical protein
MNLNALFPEPKGLIPGPATISRVIDYKKLARISIIRRGYLTLTPSAPSTKSPVNEVPSSSFTVAVVGSTSTTGLEVLRIAGVPAPSLDVASLLSSSWRRTR